MWTQDAPNASTDGDVRIILVGDMCQTGWQKLDHRWPYNDFQQAAGDEYNYTTKDIGSKVK